MAHDHQEYGNRVQQRRNVGAIHNEGLQFHVRLPEKGGELSHAGGLTREVTVAAGHGPNRADLERHNLADCQDDNEGEDIPC